MDKSFIKEEYKMSGSSSKVLNKFPTNQKIISNLFTLKRINETLSEKYKVAAYNRAIQNIAKLDYNITLDTVSSLLKNKLLGQRIYDKIRELLTTGKIQDIEKVNKKYKEYTELIKVKGLGEKAVKILALKGITNIDKLKQNTHLLNKQQLLGVKYFNDFNTKIPRAEITELTSEFKKYIRLDIEVAGSYRRQKAFSSDIDCIIKLEQLVKKYNTLNNFITFIKGFPGFVDFYNTGTKKVTVLIKSPISKLVRQMDIILVPQKYYYAALMYFTGSKEFNERIRSYVKKRGFRLNEYYLMNIQTKEIILIKSEKHLFDLFNLTYLVPSKR